MHSKLHCTSLREVAAHTHTLAGFTALRCYYTPTQRLSSVTVNRYESQLNIRGSCQPMLVGILHCCCTAITSSSSSPKPETSRSSSHVQRIPEYGIPPSNNAGLLYSSFSKSPAPRGMGDLSPLGLSEARVQCVERRGPPFIRDLCHEALAGWEALAST